MRGRERRRLSWLHSEDIRSENGPETVIVEERIFHAASTGLPGRPNEEEKSRREQEQLHCRIYRAHKFLVKLIVQERKMVSCLLGMMSLLLDSDDDVKPYNLLSKEAVPTFDRCTIKHTAVFVTFFQSVHDTSCLVDSSTVPGIYARSIGPTK
jgi:hypothetical protein